MQIYNDEKKRIGTLTGFRNRVIVSTLDTGDKELSFEYPADGIMVELLKEEYYIRTKTDEYVIKEVAKTDTYNTYTAVLNVEELEGKQYPYGFASIEQPIQSCLEFAFEGTGWTIGTCTVTKRRTIDKEENVSAWDIMQDCLKTYRCECSVDTINKTIHIYNEIGQDRGCYFMEGLNLRKLTSQSDTYEFYTRIIPIGKDGITIEWLTGKEYLENYQYSKKIKTYTWKDERYTNTTSLMEDAEAKLEELSKPYKVYSADVIDLAKASEEYKNILDYGIGDTVWMISKKTKVKEKQRIVRIEEYPETPEKNTVELSNTTKTFAEVQKEETELAKQEAVSIANSSTKKVLADYLTTEEIETKITASKEAVELGVTSTLKNYYTKVDTESLISISKTSILQEVKKAEESTMHNYVVNGDFSDVLNNWEKSESGKILPAGIGTKTGVSIENGYIYQNIMRISGKSVRLRFKAATGAKFESTASLRCTFANKIIDIPMGGLKSTLTTFEKDIEIQDSDSGYQSFSIYFMTMTSDVPVMITDVEVLGKYSFYAESKFLVTTKEINAEIQRAINEENTLKASINMNAEAIESKVSNGELGTKITQNAYYVRVAWNNNSNYIQFEGGGITVYDGAVQTDKKRAIFDYSGEHFYRDGYYVGKIGTSQWSGDESHKGLVFDLEYQGKYMAFAEQIAPNASEYTTMLCFSRANSIYEKEGLHVGCDLDMHGFFLKNPFFEGGGIDGTIRFKQPIEIAENGMVSLWATAYLTFRNGILIDGNWY